MCNMFYLTFKGMPIVAQFTALNKKSGTLVPIFGLKYFFSETKMSLREKQVKK